jgi:hypothetical protein
MRFISFDDFNFRQGQIPGKEETAVACAIATSSDVDVCEVDGHNLGPGAIVPCTPGAPIKAVRGWRTGTLTDTRLDARLVLQLYDPCDVMVPPGPRAPVMRSAIVPAASIGAAAGTAGLVLRLPCAGRDQVAVSIRRRVGSALELGWILRGVRYQSRANLAAAPIVGGLVDAASYIQEVTGTLFDGGGAVPTSTAPDAQRLGAVTYIGGLGDLAERLDEVEVWLYGAADSNLYVTAEGWGR